MINPDDGQWLTYREAAVVLGLTPVADLRSRLDAADRRLDAAIAAERKAADEASALRAAIDQRRAWGLLRRLYAALRRI